MRARMIAKSSAARGRFTSAPPIALVKIWSRPHGPLIAGEAYCNRVNFQEQAVATTPRLGRRSPVSESRRKRVRLEHADGVGGVVGQLAFAAGERVRSFAIITTAPNELCARLHNRMPAILAPEAWPEWLGEQPADEARLKFLAGPLPFRRHDLLAGQRARRQCPEQRFEPDRAGRGGVNARSAPENLST